MNLDHSNAALFAALALAQGEIENATKASTNPHFKSRYADLAEVLNTVRPVLSKHGLAIVQSTESNGEMVSVTTAIVHKEGGHISSTASCVPAKWDGQGVGAATTYLRRYGLAAMCAIAQEDDDGQSAAHNRPIQKPAGPPSREFSLLECLARHPGRVFSREQIEAHLYSESDSPLSNAVDAAIYSLRKKLSPDGAAPVIHTRRGLGYVIEAP